MNERLKCKKIRTYFAITICALLVFTSAGRLRAQVFGQPRMTPDEYYRLVGQAGESFDRSEFAKAAELYERLVGYYPDDSELWQRLGDCRYNIKQYAEAAAAYEKSLTLKTGSPPFDLYRIAQAYALTGDKQKAIEWLDRSLAAGYEQRPGIGRDPAFAILRGDRRFSELAGELPPQLFSRDEGWRYDLAYLRSEVRRLHYLYRSRPLPAGFDEDYAALYAAIPRLSDEQIIARLQGLIARLGDGHSVIYFMGEKHALKQLPVQWYLFSDGLYVVHAGDDLKRLIGRRVVQIGELGTMEALKRLAPYVSQDNPMFVKAIGLYFLTFPDVLQTLGIVSDPKQVSLTLEERDGRRETVVLRPVPPSRPHKYLTPSELPDAPPPPMYMRRQTEPYWFEYLPQQKAIYFQFNQVMNKPDEPMSDFASRLSRALDEQQAQSLIIDVRHNFGGNAELLRPLLRTLIHFETEKPNARIYVVTGRTTFSAAQIFIAQVNRYMNAVFVGEPSSSSPNFVGEETPVELPYSGVLGSISSRYHQVNGLDYRFWIAPKVPVALPSEDYFTNKDPALEAVFRLLGESLPLQSDACSLHYFFMTTHIFY